MSWWSTASHEARLQQIDAGLSLGMTWHQIALATGGDVTGSILSNYGWRFGRRSSATPAASARTSEPHRARKELRLSREAYFTGSARPDPDQVDLVDIMAGAE